MAKSNSILGLIKSITCKLDYIEENCTVCMGQAVYPEKCKKPYTTNLETIISELEDKANFIAENCFGCDEEPVVLLTEFISNSAPSEDDPCSTSPAVVDFLGTYYHTGEGNAINGETVYADEVGTTLLEDGLYSYAGQFWFYVVSGIANTTINCL